MSAEDQGLLFIELLALAVRKEYRKANKTSKPRTLEDQQREENIVEEILQTLAESLAKKAVYSIRLKQALSST